MDIPADLSLPGVRIVSVVSPALNVWRCSIVAFEMVDSTVRAQFLIEVVNQCRATLFQILGGNLHNGMLQYFHTEGTRCHEEG